MLLHPKSQADVSIACWTLLTIPWLRLSSLQGIHRAYPSYSSLLVPCNQHILGPYSTLLDRRRGSPPLSIWPKYPSKHPLGRTERELIYPTQIVERVLDSILGSGVDCLVGDLVGSLIVSDERIRGGGVEAARSMAVKINYLMERRGRTYKKVKASPLTS